MRHKPLGDTKKLKKGEQVLICRGLKYVGRTTLDLEDGSTAPIRIRIIPFKYLSDSELGALLMAPDNPKIAVEEIVRLAVRRGGPDNATAVGIFVDSI